MLYADGDREDIVPVFFGGFHEDANTGPDDKNQGMSFTLIGLFQRPGTSLAAIRGILGWQWGCIEYDQEAGRGILEDCSEQLLGAPRYLFYVRWREGTRAANQFQDIVANKTFVHDVLLS
jgi:hypothetical protein